MGAGEGHEWGQGRDMSGSRGVAGGGGFVQEHKVR